MLGAFTRLCRAFGKDLRLAQAAGGNVSVKLDRDWMLVKASGTRLRDVSQRRGWSRVRHAWLRARLESSTERSYAESVAASARGGDLRPSLEAGLHAAIRSPWVAHLHSLSAVLVGTLDRDEGLRLCRRALGAGLRPRFVAARLPGRELALEASRAPGRGGFWILENHGLIAAGSSASELRTRVAAFERVAAERFGLGRMALPHLLGAADCRERPSHEDDCLCFCRWERFHFDERALTPDFAFYARGLKRLSERAFKLPASFPGDRADARELLFAQAALATAGAVLGGMRPLARAAAEAVAGLPCERHRLSRLRAA